MADEADMRNELADLQTRADQVADDVRRTHTHIQLSLSISSLYLCPIQTHLLLPLTNLHAVRKQTQTHTCMHANTNISIYTQSGCAALFELTREARSVILVIHSVLVNNIRLYIYFIYIYFMYKIYYIYTYL